MLIESRFIISSLFISAVILFLTGIAAFVGKSEAFERRVEWWRRQGPLKRVAVVAVLIGVIAYAGTKPDPSGGDGMGGASTNDVTQVEGDVNGTNDVGWIEGDATNLVGGVDGGDGTENGEAESFPLQGGEGSAGLSGSGASSSFSRSGKDSASPLASPAFSLVSVGHEETFDFTPPETAVVATNWLLHGASTQPIRLSLGDWLFPFGDENHSNFTVFASGEVTPGGVGANSFLKPFAASLGIVPAANWRLLPTNCNSIIRRFDDSTISPASLFWHELTPSNTLLLTWQNALLDRTATNPVSFQAELKPSGGFVFRYDLSRLASDDLLTNVVIGAKNGEAESFPLQEDGAVRTNLSSLTFQTLDEGTCDERRTEFDARLGDIDPYLYPEGSTNTVLEHVFYSGTTNGAFASPQSTDDNAVLMVTVSGHGSGELMVGSTFVPLVGRPAPVSAPRLFAAPPPSPSTLAVAVPRGETCPVYMRGDSTLTVSYSSSDFAFGELPDLSGRHFRGWINFPNVRATVPCIHDYNARQKLVTLPVGEGADELTCEWHGTDKIAVENIAPRSATITGRFSGRTTTPVTYTLEHPRYLFGQKTYSQTARFCPRPNDDEDEEDDDDGQGSDGGGGASGGGGEGGSPEARDFYDGVSDEDDPGWECWCCFWGSCRAGCGCGCFCDVSETGGTDGGDDGEDVGGGGGGEGGGGPSADPGENPSEDPEPDDYDVVSEVFPRLQHVLKVRAAPLPLDYTAPIRLTVPDEHRNCCPCPDHASNFVAVVYRSSRLKVTDTDGVDFSRSGESLDVRIAAVRPSAEVGDACVSFAANGDVCFERAYTAVGVGIERDGASPDGLPDLQAYDALNPDFGLPMIAATNLDLAARLALLTNVRLPFGNVHLGFEGSNATFAAWVCDPDTGAYRKLADGTHPLDLSLSNWRRRVGKASDEFSPRTWIRVTASAAGPATLVFRYWGLTDGGELVEDEVRQPITAVNPPVTGDVSRDGRIDGTDADLQIAGRLFRFWYNEDVDKGDYVGQVADSRRNGDDAVVNGKYDLVNLFPLKLDVTDFIRAWGNAARFRLRSGIGGVRFCILSDLSPQDVAAMQTETIHTADEGVLESAELTELDLVGTSLSETLTDDAPTAMLAFEASGSVSEWSAPELVVSLGDQDVFRYRLPLSISSVDDMYRWVNLRGAESDSTTEVQFPGPCSGLPDECLSRDYVFFLHGFNVTTEQARDWNRAMFKRFWWSGSRARYCGVTWNGDDGWINGFSYHLNAFNALKTSDALKNLVNAAPSAQSKVVIAHSLGNMVACEAIRKGMNVDKYFMLNAAVASECFDDSLQGTADNIALYVPQSWRNYPSGSWCSNWSDLFGTSDDRSNLKWKGVFADVVGLTDVYNYYSTGDEVLEADDSVTSLFSGAINWKWSTHFTWSFPFLVIDKPYDLTLERYAWQKQEILKGVDPLVATIGAGWRFDSDPHIDPDDGEFWESICTPAEAQQRLTDGSIVTNSVFGHDVPTFYLSTINAEDRYRTVAYNVPAISKPTGSTTVSRGFIGNYDLDASEDSVVEDMRPNGWGRAVAPYTTRWLHSDVKDMSFYFSYKVFNAILEEGGLK